MGGKHVFTFDEGDVSTHFYFEGKTTRPFDQLPWTLSVHYALNGVTMKAEDLAGKTGVVEITIDAIPNENASAYTRNNYTLEAMAIFNQDDILSLEAPGAQVQLIGNLRAVLFIGLSGEECHYTIRVGGNDFSFGGMTFLLVPATLSQLKEIARLSARKDDLEDNYEKLSGSMDSLLDAMAAMTDSLNASATVRQMNELWLVYASGKVEYEDEGNAPEDGGTLSGELLHNGPAVVPALAAMLLTMESTTLPFVLLANIGIAVVFNFGTNVFLGEISYITQAIAAVLQLGVTMDYSVFLYRRYQEERGTYEDRRDAMEQAILAAFRSPAGSGLTTVAGFAALCFMRLTLGRDIGVVMMKGVVLGVAAVILVLPSFILLADRQIDKHRHKSLLPDFTDLNRWILKHRVAIVVFCAVLAIPAYYAQSHASIYYKLDESLPRDLPGIVANTKLKDEFDMSTNHFILLRDDLSAADMSAMEKGLEAVPGVTGMISDHSLLGTGIPDFFIPGEGAMTEDLIRTTAVDFVVTNYISIAAIFIIAMVVFKSVSIPAALVAAIEFAIFLNQGVPCFTGTEVPFVAPNVISCIRLGATVDYAILMTSRFQEELRRGKDRHEAALIAGASSDASVITGALVLFRATLGVSFVSSIDLIGAICVMLARGAIISGLVSIFLIPALRASVSRCSTRPPSTGARRSRKRRKRPCPPQRRRRAPSEKEAPPQESGGAVNRAASQADKGPEAVPRGLAYFLSESV